MTHPTRPLLDAASETRTGSVLNLFKFCADELPWRNIDDAVMGGRSASEMRFSYGSAVFSGNVSMQNGGGFASARSQPIDHDLTRFRGISIRVRGDGKVYAIRIRSDRGFDGVNYQASLETVDGKWIEIRIPFDLLLPVFRGRPVSGYPPLDRASIKTFGLMVSRRQMGPFRLEVDWIRAYE